MRKKLFLLLFAPVAVFAFGSCAAHGGIFQNNCQCPKFGENTPAKHINESHASIQNAEVYN